MQNSPADKVPSHGTRLFGTAYSIDLVPVDGSGRTAPFTPASMFRAEPPEHFPGFGLPVLAPAAGTVVRVHDGEPDHGTHRGFPSIGYALTQRRRLRGGWVGLAGNHVILQLDATVGPVFVALCHLRRGRFSVRPGDRVGAGVVLGECGNSGNSTEPHLHLQAMDTPDAERAEALAITFPLGLPRNREIVSAGQD